VYALSIALCCGVWSSGVCPSPAHAGGGTSIWTMEGSMISCQSRTHARSPVRLVPRARIRGMAGETAVSDRTPIEHMVEEPSLLLLGLTTVGWRLGYVENFSHPMQHNTSMIHLTKKGIPLHFRCHHSARGPASTPFLPILRQKDWHLECWHR
jgi:hypothetical protein